MRRAFLPLVSLGFLAQVAQVALLREFLAAFQGNELVVGIVLGAWTVAVAAGGLLGVLLRRRPERALASLAVLPAAVLPACILGIRSIRAVFPAPGGQLLPIDTCLLAAPLLLAPAAIVLGAAFPVGVRLLAEAGAKGEAGNAYGLEAIGSVLGGAATSFVLLPGFGAFALVLVGSAVHLVVVAARAAGTVERLVLGVAAVAAGAAAIADPLDRPTAEVMWRRFLPEFHLAETRHARRGEVAVVEYQGQSSVYLGGHLVSSLPDRGEAAPLATLALLQHPSPRRILVLEEATSGLPKTLLVKGVESLVLVDSEPAVLAAAMPRMAEQDGAALRDARVRQVTADPRAFMRGERASWDLVVLLPSDPLTLASDRLYTEEFLQEVRRALTPQGVLVLGGFSGSGAYLGDELLERNASLYAVARRVFSKVLVTPGSSWNLLCGGSESQVSLDEDEVLARLTARGLPLVDVFGMTERSQVRRWNDLLAAATEGRPRPAEIGGTEQPFPPLDLANSDTRPLACYQSLRLWDRVLRDRVSPLLPHSLRVQKSWLWAWAAVCLVPPFLVRRKSFALGQAVFGAGFASMGLTVVVLLSFQCALGDLVQWVGALLSFFMLGLFLGSRGGKGTTSAWVLVLAFIGLGTPWLLGGVSPAPSAVIAAAHGLVLLAAGAATGRVFAGATASGLGPARGYALDLLGAALAAAVVGSHLLPLWGIGWTCLVLALPAIGSLMMQGT